MIPRSIGFLRRGRALGEQTGEEHRRLHLSASDRDGVSDRLQPATLELKRRTLLLTGDNPSADRPERSGHTPHGPAGKRSIAMQSAGKVVAGQNSRHHAHGRAGVAAIQTLGGRSESFSSFNFEYPPARFRTLAAASNPPAHLSNAPQGTVPNGPRRG